MADKRILFTVFFVVACTYFVLMNHDVLSFDNQYTRARESVHFRNSRNDTNRSIALHPNVTGSLNLTFDEENKFLEFNSTATTRSTPAEIHSKVFHESTKITSTNRDPPVEYDAANLSTTHRGGRQMTKNSVLINDPYKHFKPMMIIPSEEGLISQYVRVTGFLEKAKEYNRSLVLFPFVSHHYKDIAHSVLTTGGRINLCDIFYFPYNLVTCYDVRRNPVTVSTILAENKCAPYQFNGWMKSHPDHFGLESFEGLSSQPFDFATSECAIIGTQGGPKKWSIEIKFTYKYNELLKVALESLKRIRLERTSGFSLRALNASTGDEIEGPTISSAIHENRSFSLGSKHQRRRLNSWVNMTKINRKLSNSRRKKRTISEMKSTSQYTEDAKSVHRGDAKEVFFPTQAPVVYTDKIDEESTKNTITYQYYLNSLNHSIENASEKKAHHIVPDSTTSNQEESFYREIIEPGGQKLEVNVAVANSSLNFNHSRIVRDNKSRSRLHYRDRVACNSQSCDGNFNTSDLPSIESEESSLASHKISIDENGKNNTHASPVSRGDSVRQTYNSGNTRGESSFTALNTKFGSKMDNQVQKMYRNFSLYDSTQMGFAMEKMNFIVAHWRRGDQLTSSLRCRNGLDNSVNCGSVQNFIKEINGSIQNVTKYDPTHEVPLVYVCTNEESPNSIFELNRNNFILYHDLVNYASSEEKARKLASLKSLDRFILEIQLMIYSTRFIHFGITTIQSFVKHGRIQLQERLKKLMKVRREI